LKETFVEMGVEVTPENKRDIDKEIHKLVGVEYKNCSAVWKEFKKRRAEDESGFMSTLDGVLGKF
jgi:hypothetical protein